MNFAQIIGSSASLRKALKRVETVAPTDRQCSFMERPATGKELIARGIHDLSPAKPPSPSSNLTARPFPTGLLESELFGHEKGAFTGPSRHRIWRFRSRRRRHDFSWTKIGEILWNYMTKLLRVLQEREFRAAGKLPHNSERCAFDCATNAIWKRW